MIRVNLRELYPDYYSEDIFTEMSEEVMEEIIESRRLEASAQRKKYRHKAQYSLNYGNEAGYVDTSIALTPETVLENTQLRDELYKSVMELPRKQSQRIYAKFYLGLSVDQIAQCEGVSKSRISESIRRGLEHLKKISKNFLE